MDELTIQKIVDEMDPLLKGHRAGRIFQLSRTDIAIDFHIPKARYLFISATPAEPCLYLITRSARQIEEQAVPLSRFLLGLKKVLTLSELLTISRDEGDRIVRFSFLVGNEAGETRKMQLVAQLTGRTSNLFLLDGENRILDTFREPRGEGQEVGEFYSPPVANKERNLHLAPFVQGRFPSLSEAAADFYQRRREADLARTRITAARQRVRSAIERRRKLRRRLTSDLEAQGEAGEHKRIGDLLLANIETAERHGNIATVIDYSSDGMPRVEILLDENSSLQEEAARRFKLYGKAKRGAEEISRRREKVNEELEDLLRQQAAIDQLTGSGEADADVLLLDAEPRPSPAVARRSKKEEHVSGARRYRSSDGLEVLVGRGARENDYLTFRIARPHDLWLHAGDYPGSHVVIRNSSRGDVPHRSVIEAAQLAAYFSHARKDSKVNVHYTQRKFLQKPKGSAPGLVRMSSFRSITVEPRESIARVDLGKE